MENLTEETLLNALRDIQEMSIKPEYLVVNKEAARILRKLYLGKKGFKRDRFGLNKIYV